MTVSIESAFAGLAIAVATFRGLSWWFWRPRNKTISTTPEQQPDPPAPEVVDESRIKRPDGTTSESPTPTPPGQFAVSEKYADSLSPSEDQNSSSADFDDLEYDWVTEADVSMSDVGGMDDLKTELETDVIKPLTTGKEKAEALDIPLPNIVFYGPPGTGKTYLAKALATELELPFAKLSGSDVQSKWINESATKISTLFDEAKAVATKEGGAIVFLDELDAVLKQRSGAGQSHEEDNKVVAEFLNHLQETSEHDILFIGATNRLDALDDAGIRAGRIDKKIHVGKPDQDARKAILRSQLTDRPNDLIDKQIAEVAERTNGLVAADLESLVVDAARASAFEREGEMIRWGDLCDALDQRGI